MKVKTPGIRRNGDGTATIDFIYYVKNGAPIHIYKTGIQSVAIAKELKSVLIAEKLKEKSLSFKPVLVDDLIDRYLAHCSEAGLASNTVRGKYYWTTKYVLPLHGKDFISALLSSDGITKWRGACIDHGSLSVARKNKCLMEMRQLLQFARKSKMIDAQACEDSIDLLENVKEIRAPKKPRKTWTIEQTKAFLNAIPKDSRDFVMFTLLVWTGSRRGEILGLQKKCHHDGVIDFIQQVVSDIGPAKLTQRMKTNESYRSDPLPDDLDKMLQDYEFSLGLKEDDFLFSVSGGKRPMSISEIRRRFLKYGTMANVPLITLHGLRHTKAKRFKENIKTAADAQAASRFLGHSVIVDMDVYGQATDEDVKSFVESNMDRMKQNHKNAKNEKA